MTLLARIESAMRDAMKARDEQRTQTLRMAMAAAHNQRISRGRELTDDEVVDVLTKQVKQRRESIAMYRDAGREERAAAEEAEAAILADFLPQQLSDAEIEARARAGLASDRGDGRGCRRAVLRAVGEHHPRPGEPRGRSDRAARDSCSPQRDVRVRHRDGRPPRTGSRGRPTG